MAIWVWFKGQKTIDRRQSRTRVQISVCVLRAFFLLPIRQSPLRPLRWFLFVVLNVAEFGSVERFQDLCGLLRSKVHAFQLFAHGFKLLLSVGQVGVHLIGGIFAGLLALLRRIVAFLAFFSLVVFGLLAVFLLGVAFSLLSLAILLLILILLVLLILILLVFLLFVLLL